MIRSSLFVALFFSSFQLSAQCPVGQTPVNITIQPDNLGAETSWVLKNSSSQVVLGNGGPYTNGNTSPITVPLCVNDGSNATFVIQDSFGDGMCCLQGTGFYYIMIGSDTIAKNGTFTSTDSVRFLAPPVTRDVSVLSINIQNYVDQNSQIISGILANKGTVTISSLKINFQVNSGIVHTKSLGSVNIPKFKSAGYSFTSTTPWIPDSVGYFTIHVWASDINGSNDLNMANDSCTKTVYAADHLAAKTVLLETFTSSTEGLSQLSEDVLDTLIAHNKEEVSVIKYHSGIPTPGNDPMFLGNITENNARRTYYSLSSVPSVVMDGNAYSGTANGISQAGLDQQIAKSGLFDISLEESKTNNDVSIHLKTTCLVPFTGVDVKAFVVILENPVHFSSAPAPSTKSDFSWVMRKILPGSSGTTLGSPVVGQENSFVYSFLADPALYDTSNLRTLIFLQDNNSKEILQVFLGKDTTGSNIDSTTGMIKTNTIQNDFDFVLFPNPAVSQFSICNFDYKITSIDVFSILGENVFFSHSAINIKQVETINLSNQPTGLYFVKVSTGDQVKVKKLLLVK